MRASRPSSFKASFFTSSGMPALLNLLPQLLGVARGLVLLTQFLLDGLHLLAQVVLALRLLHAVLHFALDLVAQLLDFQLLGQMLVDLFQPHANVGVSSTSCLSRVESDGSEDAMKSTIRPGSSIFPATVDSSSDSVGEPATICWNSVSTLRCRASISEFFGHRHFGNRFHRRVHERRQLGVFGHLDALQALGKDEQALVGHRTTLCTTARLPTANRSVGCGVSTRASRWATTTMVLSSPSELISCTELSRPTVSGSTA
jgi:hypothetical protein